MERLRVLLSRCAALFLRRQLDEDLDAEFAAHVDLAIEENIQGGMSAQEARTEALRQFGGVIQTKETYRVQQGLPFLETTAMNVRYALRQLRKLPAFSVTAILTLALDIGGMTAVFSVVQAMLLRASAVQGFRAPHKFATNELGKIRLTTSMCLLPTF